MHDRLEIIMMARWIPLGIGHNLKVPFFVFTDPVPVHHYILITVRTVLLVVKA